MPTKKRQAKRDFLNVNLADSSRQTVPAVIQHITPVEDHTSQKVKSNSSLKTWSLNAILKYNSNLHSRTGDYAPIQMAPSSTTKAARQITTKDFIAYHKHIDKKGPLRYQGYMSAGVPSEAALEKEIIDLKARWISVLGENAVREIFARQARAMSDSARNMGTLGYEIKRAGKEGTKDGSSTDRTFNDPGYDGAPKRKAHKLPAGAPRPPRPPSLRLAAELSPDELEKQRADACERKRRSRSGIRKLTR